jgi:hypothetical protein
MHKNFDYLVSKKKIGIIIITFVPPSVPFVRHLHKYSRRKQDSF